MRGAGILGGTGHGEGMEGTEGRRTLDADVDVVLLAGLGLPACVISLRERIEGLEILDVRGHEIDWSALLVRRVGRADVLQQVGGGRRVVGGAATGGALSCGVVWVEGEGSAG